jgi:YdjC-like protein
MSQVQKGDANTLLGYPADARLLIINADDFGMCHASNDAILRSLTDGVVCSTSHAFQKRCESALHKVWVQYVPDGLHVRDRRTRQQCDGTFHLLVGQPPPKLGVPLDNQHRTVNPW